MKLKLIENMMLNVAIRETKEILNTLNAMKFKKVDKILVGDCDSFEEFRLRFQTYFIENLVNCMMFEGCEETITEIRAKMAEVSNYAEIIVVSQELFKLVFVAKMKILEKAKSKVFYPDKLRETIGIKPTVIKIL